MKTTNPKIKVSDATYQEWDELSEREKIIFNAGYIKGNKEGALVILLAMIAAFIGVCTVYFVSRL